MFSAIVSELSGPGLSPAWGHCVDVFLDKTLLFPQFLACIYHFAGKTMCTNYQLLFPFFRRYFKDMPQIALDKKSNFEYIE